MEYTLEKLEVYCLAETLADEVWEIADSWNFFVKDTIGKQVVRSADSISANIAEGYGRYYYKESKQFFFYARGSLLETKAWIGKCIRRRLYNIDKCNELLKRFDEIHVKLNAYIKFVSKSSKHNSKQ